MYNVDLYTALLSSVCKELHIHIDNGISPLILSVKDWIGQSRGSLISSGVRKEHRLLFDSCHDVLAVVVAWSQSTRCLQTITYHYLLNLLSHLPTPV